MAIATDTPEPQRRARQKSAEETGTRFGPYLVYAALCALRFLSTSLQAQKLGAQVSARWGIAVADDRYQTACGAISGAFSLDVKGNRKIFPQIALDHFAGAGGGDVACVPVDPSVATAVGGLKLDGATRLGLGVGARLGAGLVQLEGAVSSGIITGRRGFVANANDASRHVMPHVGGQASLILFRFVVLSSAINWTRLSLHVQPRSGGPETVRTSWPLMTTWQVGVRVRAGR